MILRYESARALGMTPTDMMTEANGSSNSSLVVQVDACFTNDDSSYVFLGWVSGGEWMKCGNASS